MTGKDRRDRVRAMALLVGLICCIAWAATREGVYSLPVFACVGVIAAVARCDRVAADRADECLRREIERQTA